jgi:hypothetical protein
LLLLVNNHLCKMPHWKTGMGAVFEGFVFLYKWVLCFGRTEVWQLPIPMKDARNTGC